jgi:hypothetical protein
MKTRILIWAAVGFFVATFWAAYLFVTPPAAVGPDLLMAAKITLPFAFASIHFHFALAYYWAIIANTITYGLFALLVETMRPHRPAL